MNKKSCQSAGILFFTAYAIIKLDLPVLINQLEYVLKYVEPMAMLEVSLFGPFQASLNSSPVTQFESAKVRTLLAYLAMEAVHPHPHESLVAWLCPDWPQRLARKSYDLKHAPYTPRI